MLLLFARLSVLQQAHICGTLIYTGILTDFQNMAAPGDGSKSFVLGAGGEAGERAREKRDYGADGHASLTQRLDRLKLLKIIILTTQCQMTNVMRPVFFSLT